MKKHLKMSRNCSTLKNEISSWVKLGVICFLVPKHSVLCTILAPESNYVISYEKNDASYNLPKLIKVARLDFFRAIPPKFEP